MQRIAIFLFSLSFLLACGSETKEAKLARLKAQHKQIAQEISRLEKEIGRKTGAKEQDNIRTKIVSVKEISYQPFQHFIDLQGRIEAKQNINMSAKMPGTITRVYVTEGMAVAAGQALAEIDNTQILQAIQEVETQLSFAQTLYLKQKDLWDNKIGTEVQFLTAKNQKESLEKRLASLKDQLDKTIIRSSIAGTVDEVYAKIGESTAPGAPCVRVVNLSDLRLVADVAEAHVSKIKIGTKAIVEIPDTKKEFNATVSFYSKAINPTNRTFKVEVRLPADADLRPNMYAKLKIVDYEVKDAITIPINVIQNSEEGSFVMIATTENNRQVARKRKVTVGQTYNKLAEIKEGLSVGDKLITIGYLDLNDGDIIKF
ncbi:MAG: efflux RND transporter periplasmic adaptor subunit [Microscillaceae bacterium]|nr:efflux RND transporter periplasmic adaptor subunit [Microscillaceae bacterium]MDW8460906.1 efflux RND transporter periplasmic adaptor subunit [Cytophagales bacterium]